MSFKKYIEDNLGESFPIVVEELGYLGNNHEPNVLVIRKFTGINYKNSVVIPVQLEIITDDVNATFDIINDFAKNHTTLTFESGLDYIKQNYNTPSLNQAFLDNGLTVVSIVTLNGTLVITQDIVDIESLTIDGEDIYFDEIQENYVAINDSPKKIEEWLHKSTIRGGVNKILISSLTKNNMLLKKINNIKRGNNSDIIFKVKVKYNNDDLIMEYDMKLDSYSSIYTSANIPFSTISLTE